MRVVFQYHAIAPKRKHCGVQMLLNINLTIKNKEIIVKKIEYTIVQSVKVSVAVIEIIFETRLKLTRSNYLLFIFRGVFTNHSKERSQFRSADFSIFSSIRI